MKRVISACLEQTLKFVAEEDYQNFIKGLERRRVKFKAFDKQVQPDNTITVKIIKNQKGYAIGDYLK